MECSSDALETYHEASLNGVTFYATALSDDFGRRGPVHEYPDRDTPAAEDLGRKARRYNVTGWIGGADHASGAKALQRAAERVSPSTLVHPIWGRLSVKIESCTIKHDVETLIGRTDITIKAVEFGGLSFPTLVAAIGAVVGGAIGGLIGAIGLFVGGTFNTNNFTQAAVNQTTIGVRDAAQAVYDEFLGAVEWNDVTPDVLDDLQLMIDSPESHITGETRFDSILATAMQTLQENATDPDVAIASFERLMRYGPEFVEASGPSADQIADNINAIISTVRILAVSYAVVAATESVKDDFNTQAANDLKTILPTQARFASSADAIAFLDKICETIDAEIEIAASRCDDAYVRALRDLLHASIDEMQHIAFDLPPRIVTDVCFSLPSLVAAYKATGDAKRVLDVECTNPGRSKWFMRREIESRGLNIQRGHHPDTQIRL